MNIPASPPACGNASQRLYWPQLDGLRFLAALLVIIHHAPRPPGMPIALRRIGWMGVDLFLVLSAFLLARLLRAEVERTGAIQLGKYLARRALRIWPLYLGFVTASLCYVISTDGLNAQWIGVYCSHLAFVNNYVTAWFGYGVNLPSTASLWTISLEEQFYLVIPLVLPALLNCSPRRLLAMLASCLVFLILARATCLALDLRHPFIWTTPLRGDAFVLGVGLALGAFDRLSRALRGDWLCLAGLLLLGSGGLLGRPGLMSWSTALLYTVTDGACLLIVMGCLHGARVNRILCTPPVRYLGRISFGLYVYHLLAIAIADAVVTRCRWHQDGWLEFGLTLAILCVLSVASYELYEKWFLRLKTRFEIVASRPLA